jgi:hypothetical protein
MVTGSTRGVPVHWMSWAGFATSVVACLLALYGSMHAEKHIAGSPLRQARGSAGLPAPPGPWYERMWVRGEASVFGERFDSKVLALTERSKIANYTLQMFAYVLPLALGVVAALTGGAAMKAVQRSQGRRVGNTLAVFAIMTGGLAVIIAASMVLAVYVWQWVPAAYTN